MKIFVTVGAQMPFDRLIKAVDAWAAARPRTVDIIAQISPGGWRPAHMRFSEHLDASSFEQHAAQATLIVGHAGMGTILTAMQHGKPLLVLPRRGHLNETRNDHQMATARHFAQRTPMAVAWDASELPEFLDHADRIAPMPLTGSFASEPLLRAIRQAIHPNQNELVPRSRWRAVDVAHDEPLRFPEAESSALEQRKAA